MSTKNFLEKFYQNRILGNKGQLQIGISMIVLLVFIVLIVISLLLYFRFTFEEISETQESLLDQKYGSLLSVIIGLPEFRCSRLGVENECLDAAKLFDINDVVRANQDYYRGLFGGANKIWVEMKGADESDGYFNAKEFLIYQEDEAVGLVYSVPVSVYYPDERKHKIGILKIQGELE